MTLEFVGQSICAMRTEGFAPEDGRRAREFYRYLQPDNLVLPHLRRRSSTFDLNHDHIPSLSEALAPFCQLTAIRCTAAKAMLNVMNRDVMYFLAEASLQKSTKGGEEIIDFVADPILLQCSNVPLTGRICELTLRMDKPADPTQYATFVIPDLTQSDFKDMSIIAGPPYYRFYAGVPITTRGGVNIGSLAIMDTIPRPNGLTSTEEEFLGRTAEQIMTYLETNRQAIEGRRSRRMAEGLEAFVAGKKSILDQPTNPRFQRASKKRALPVYGISAEPQTLSTHLNGDRSSEKHGPTRTNGRSDSVSSLTSEASSSALSGDGNQQHRTEEDGDSRSHSKTFARAANLLRESVGDLGEEGSVHFVRLATRLGGDVQRSPSDNRNASHLPTATAQDGHTAGGSGEGYYRGRISAQVVASSLESDPLGSDSNNPQQVLSLDNGLLRDIMRRYPSGCLWILDELTFSSDDDDANGTVNGYRSSTAEKSHRASKRKKTESVLLKMAFPNARQVLFTPIWDAAIGSFAYGCFITSALETRSFSSTTDLPFLNSFCSTVMSECSRLDVMAADRQKSDFVGTISHEMRSPLHGVLASVEFLAETDVTSFQRNLVETINSCGRTLLDTINHVLDFSKVNSFEKQWQAANKRGSHGVQRNHYLGPDNLAKAMSHGAPPLLQLTGVTDISTVLEEVVDGLVLGHTYNSGIDITDTSREARGRSNGMSESTVAISKSDPVDIILDVQHGDWTFLTQPGAVRRIIMNITGNAIKYTNHGTIQVQLQQKESSDDGSNARSMVLTVTDTGKGISQDFLSSRLFVPFAQENALAPGTGLGMSIVRSIVLMLGGTIEVTSKVGKGTTVEVVLPMQRPLPGQVSSQNTPHSGGTGISGNSNDDDSILLLQNQAHGETITFYRRKPIADDPLLKTVQHYAKEWYNLEYRDQRLIENTSIIIVEAEDLEDLMKIDIGAPGKRPVVVVMCSVSFTHSNSLLSSLEERLSSPVEFVARPCGPNKLARGIRHALQKKRTLKPRFSHVTDLGIIHEAITPGSTTVTPAVCDPAGNALQEMALSAPSEGGVVVHASETFAASQVSQHAQMAINDLSADHRTPRAQGSDHDAFPFPVQYGERSRQPREKHGGDSLSSQHGLSTTTNSNGVATKQTKHTATKDVSSIEIDPRILLVDDNQINLRLLETFLQRKRKYTQIEKAEDGAQAVDAVMTSTKPYDIIFMDISMPIMNGFEATRAIRDFEEQTGVTAGAMVIALTGLASGRDQNEGFDSGCDIYMTKPVSFKEVGKLLDNWEGHQRTNLELERTNGDLAHLDLKPSVGVAADLGLKGARDGL